MSNFVNWSSRGLSKGVYLYLVPILMITQESQKNKHCSLYLQIIVPRGSIQYIDQYLFIIIYEY